MSEIKDRAEELIARYENHLSYSYGRILCVRQAIQSDLQTVKDLQTCIEQLEKDNKDLEESNKALNYKLGDNCCACSYDSIDDVCMVHTPKVKELESRIKQLESALRLLLEAKHIKETLGVGIAYEHLKKQGWEKAESVMKGK